MRTIGIKLADGTFYPVLEEGMPQEKELELTTANNNQTRVMVDLYRSKTCTMSDAEYVDSLQIDNLIEHPTGEPDISFNVSLDENNQLSAKIVDSETGAQSNSTITLISRTLEERLNTDNYEISDKKTNDSDGAVKAAVVGGGLLAAASLLSKAESVEEKPEVTSEVPEEITSDETTETVADSFDEVATEEQSFEEPVADKEPDFDEPGSDATIADDIVTDETVVEKTADEDILSDDFSDIEIPEATENSLDDFKLPDDFNETELKPEEKLEEPDFDMDTDEHFGEREDTEEVNPFDDTEPKVEEESLSQEDDFSDITIPDMDEKPESLLSKAESFDETSEDNTDSVADETIATAFDEATTEEPAFEESVADETVPEDTEVNDFDETIPEETSTDMFANSFDEIADKEPSFEEPVADATVADDTVTDETVAEKTTDEDIRSDDFSDIEIPEDTENSLDDFSLPDDFDLTKESEKSKENEDDMFVMADDQNKGENMKGENSNTDRISFTGLYDKETELGESSVQEEIKKKTKTPMIICIICAIICILATLLILFIIPSKLNILTNKAEKTTEKVIEQPIEEPKQEVAPIIASMPEQKEEEVVIIAKAEEVVPEEPVAEKETPKIANTTYNIRWGDTLWDISNTYYKNPWKYKSIAKYNGIKNPDHIVSGTVIEIPAE